MVLRHSIIRVAITAAVHTAETIVCIITNGGRRMPMNREKTMNDIGTYNRRHNNVCEACEEKRVPKTLLPHHIKTQGSGGSDEDENLLCLCWHCHYAIVHGLPGMRELIKRYPHIRDKVVAMKPKLEKL